MALKRSGREMTARVAGKDRIIRSRSGIEIALKQSDVKDWDDIELQYGRRRDKNGHLTGRPPSFIPKACHAELMKRYHAKVEFMMTKALPEVIPELIAIAKGEKPAMQDQVRAMNMLIERTMGKVVEHVQMTVDQPWKDALSAALVGTMDQAEEIIDAEVVDETDDDVDWEEG